MDTMYRKLFVTWLASCAAVGASGGAAAADATDTHSPKVQITFHPHANGGAINEMDVSMTFHGLVVQAGQPVLRFPLNVASIPTGRYDGDAIHSHDDKGPLPLTSHDLPPTPVGVERDWVAGRDVSGNLTVEFRAQPRMVDANTRPGPLFDLREEGGGLSGAGLTFLPHLVTEQTFSGTLHWDLSSLPGGMRAMSCFGDGDVAFSATIDTVGDCYYAVGPLHRYPESGESASRFGMYWLTEPPFDAPAVGRQIQTLYGYMSSFFKGGNESYRVIIRKNPYSSGGGTALHRSFMFGWSEARKVTSIELEDLLGHEMVHNWTVFGGDHGDSSWYSEGTAEYYSILLSWRSGVIDSAEFLNRINKRAVGYYQNPLQNLTLQQAEERYWGENDASYVPYGRGFMYLTNMDAEIRAHSGGRRRLDDISVKLAMMGRSGKPATTADLRRLLQEELGASAVAEFDDMVAGRQITPRTDAFGPCFKPEKTETRLHDLGFDEAPLNGPGKHLLRGLRAGSSAERAGLREGDEVLKRPRSDQSNVMAPVSITIRREGAEKVITYVPEGKSTVSYRWSRVTAIPEAQCRY